MDDETTSGTTTTLAPAHLLARARPTAPPARLWAWRCGGGRRAEAGLTALLALAGALAYIPTAPFYFRPDDDGLLAFDATLVLHGGRPYVDFFVHDSPLINYWDALLFQLGGLDMLTLRYGLVPFKILLLPAIYLLARPLAPRPLAALAALLVLMADSAVNFGMPHPGWYAMALAFLGLLAVRAWLGSGRRAWLLAAGLALGLAVDVKQNLGLFVLAGCGLFLLEPLGRNAPAGGLAYGRGGDSRGGWALRAAAWAVVLAGLLVLLRDQFRADVLILLWLPVAALAAGSLWPLPGGARHAAVNQKATAAASPARVLPATEIGPHGRVALLAAGALLAVVPWLLILGAIAGFGRLVPGLVLEPSALAAVMFFPYKPPPPEFWQMVGLVGSTPLVAWGLLRVAPRRPALAAGGAGAWALGWLLVWGGPTFVWQGGIFTWYYVPPALLWLALLVPAPPAGPDPGAVAQGPAAALYRRFLLYAAAFGMLQLYPLMDRVHGAWSYPFTLPLLALVLARAGALLAAPRGGAMTAEPRSPGARRVLAASLLVLPLCWAWFIAGWRLGLLWDVPASLAAGRPVAADWRPLALPHASLIVPAGAAADFQGIVRLIVQRTRPGEPIFAFPNEQAFYVLAERPRGSRQSFLLPGVTTGPDQQEAIADLARNRVRYIIEYLPATSIGSLAPLAQYLAAHYHPVGTFGPAPNTYAVMEHN